MITIPGVPVRSTPTAIGERRSRQLRQRLAEELVVARLAAGLSRREVAGRVGVSADRLARAERADAVAQTIDLVARIGAALGLQLAASMYPFGDPVRDRAHLALLARFRARLHASIRWQVEVPIPISGDRRSGDAVIAGDGWDALIEAETRLDDVQLVERRAAAKQRDLGATRLILLMADTKHNRDVVALHPELLQRFPTPTRACLRSLRQGRDPGGDGLVIV